MAAPPPYSGVLETDVRFPRYHDNYITEFELTDPAVTMLSNLRLTNVGCTVTEGEYDLHPTLGVAALIKNIYLIANGTEVCHQRFLNRLWLGTWAMQSDNATQASMDASLLGTRTGYEFGQGEGPLGQIVKNLVPRAGVATTATANAETTFAGVIKLEDILMFLKATPYLHCSVMGNIILKIEWDTAKLTALTNSDAIIKEILRPELVVNLSRDPKMAEAAMQTLQKPIAYPVWIHDQFYVPAPTKAQIIGPVATAGTIYSFEQTIGARPRAFDDRFVHYLVHINEPVNVFRDAKTAAAENRPACTGRLYCASRFKGKDVIILNGKPMFGRSGIDSPARRATILSDAFPGAKTTLPGTDVSYIERGEYVTQGYKQLAGTTELTGYQVAQPVASLQIEAIRTLCRIGNYGGLDDPKNQKVNQGLITHLFGQVTQNYVQGKILAAEAM